MILNLTAFSILVILPSQCFKRRMLACFNLTYSGRAGVLFYIQWCHVTVCHFGLAAVWRISSSMTSNVKIVSTALIRLVCAHEMVY